ncbi:MAG: CHAT domain-containing protein, partial [Microcoleaceae cyanobacterium MO_207.B10]|nr:CHAT domain-containing protein [Microcoleaceae cyanobacterium MO_207.B10]
INSRNGAVDTTKGSIGTSADGKAGNVEISASGDINTEYISSFSFLEGGQGGDISIKSRNGAINTTGDSAFFGEPLKPDAKITSEDVATRFRETPANLDAYAPEGTGGNITLSAQGDITIYEVSSYGGNISGDVNITSTTGNINTDVIFSTGSIERGGNISIQTPGNIDINHIVTYSENGIGGEINLNAGGNVTINNIASFGITDSGDVSIQSNSGNIETKNIDTLAEDGISGNITLNDFGTQGNISTANINTKGGTEAGGIEITATDGSILTGDLESSSLSGNAGGIILEALTNIETGSQTVIAGIGDASISNNAGNNINVGNQTAMTESGNAMIINNAGNNITTGNQIAVTNDGISIIENNAPGNISTGTVTQLGNNIQSTTSTIAAIEQNRNNEFANYLGLNLSPQVTSTKNVREVLTDIARQTDNNSAIIYVTAYPEALQLILYTPGSDPILKTIPDANREELMKAVLQLRAQITSPARRFTDSYLPPAQQLYDWLIAPLSAELAAANIDTLLFSMDEGLRTLPVATLHDGEQFLIEKYSLSLIPSISLMDTNYQSLHNTQVLAMGASEFIQQGALPAVPVELETISQKLWQGSTFINENFTRDNLLTQRQNYPYPIIHLATHAEFKPGKANNSYIQLWGNEQLHLDEMRELGWNEPPVELLVLSACRTAFGDKNAELGFAGLAVAAGVKSALASIWYVSDEGTLGLMTEFYIHLNNAKIKAEALRQAQLAMLRGEVVITEGKLRVPGIRGAVVLPSVLGKFSNQNLSHPYYWAGFMMVGSPW